MTVIALLSFTAVARAHPVPKSNHDRTIVVRLQKSDRPEQITIHVDYRLEVDETTVLLEDMLPFKDDVDIARFRGKPLDYYAEFMRIYAPILASNLVAKVDGRPVKFACIERSPRLVDENGQSLGHLRCDFVFEASAAIASDHESAFFFREGNYQLQEGQILLGLANEADLKLSSVAAPSETLQKRSPAELKSGDEERLREVRAVLAPGAGTTVAAAGVKTPSAPETSNKDTRGPASVLNDDDSMLWLMTSDYGFWLKLLLLAWFGAVHALTPGHGKTLVAAYLIGQRGTMWHALVLGIVTTLTHTGAVLILAGVLFFLPDHLKVSYGHAIQQGLGLVAGFMVICLGAWLLLRRLAGRADHVHWGGHSHSHSHGQEHSHSHGFDLGAAQASGVRWWGLVVLGVTGGLVPCWDAIIVFLFFVGRAEFWLVLPGLLAFSAGLAATLVLIGVLVVQVPRFAKSPLGEGRFVQALPVLSSLVIVAMGFWLCYKGVQ